MSATLYIAMRQSRAGLPCEGRRIGPATLDVNITPMPEPQTSAPISILSRSEMPLPALPARKPATA